MKISKQAIRFLCAIFLGITCVFLGTNSVFAANNEQPAQRIQISPAREDIGDLDPGEKYSGIFKVQNIGTEKLKFSVGVSPYTVTNENYDQDYDTTTQYTDIINWIKFSQDSGEVEPNGEVEIAYTISVPADVASGGQYAILYAEIISDNKIDNGAGLNTIQRVGMKLYTNIEGNTRKTGSVIENKIPAFLFNPPISATSIVENTGNTHANVKYVLQVYPLFGDEEVYTNEESPTTLVLLPDTRRLNTVTWDNTPAFGIFRVKQTVSFWDESSTVEKIVFLCPIWLVFIIFLIIFCAIFWIVSRIRNRNKY